VKPNFLAGVRFADFTWAGAGAFTTKIFSDFGADVIKIETASRPDSTRISGPYRDGVRGLNRSGYFAVRNTGKKSLSVDLKRPRGRAILEELIAQADVVSNNFAAGAMERLGFGYEDVRRIKPDVIYLSMPMYGESGPRAGMPGLGMTISAVTGMTWLTGHQDGPPIGAGTHFPDHAANPNHAAFAVLAALRYRRLTGRGMKIDQSQVESTLNCVGIPFMDFALNGVDPPRTGNRSPFHAPHNLFRCRGDDRWCAVAVLSDAQWQILCRVIGRPDLSGDRDLSRAEGRLRRVDEVESAVAAWTIVHDAAAVMETLQAAGIPAGVVSSARDLIEDNAQLRHRGFWQPIDHPEMGRTPLTAPPYRVDGERVALGRPPLFGEHTDEVLRNVLGYSREQIQALHDQGALF
jgi:benzylsuccinate CoA-transferase BbsF subunit